jgi:hypothetical protein
MPNPGDLLTQEIDEDPEDQLRMQLDQGQGANLAGAPRPPGQGGMPLPGGGGVMPGGAPPSPNVPGPLAALAKKTPTTKPHIRLKSKRAEPSARKKLKVRLKPRAPSISPLQGFLNSLGS